MGFDVSWISVRGKPRQAIYEELGVTPRGPLEYELFDEPIAGATLRKGWYLITMNDACHPFVEDGSLAELSMGCEVLACQLLEATNDSLAQFWTSGQRTWFVRHTAQVEPLHLDASGQLPARFHRIRSRVMRKQIEAGGSSTDIDYVIEIPLLLAQRITGFSPSNRFRPSRRSFEVLDWAPPPKSHPTPNSKSASKS